MAINYKYKNKLTGQITFSDHALSDERLELLNAPVETVNRQAPKAKTVKKIKNRGKNDNQGKRGKIFGRKHNGRN